MIGGKTVVYTSGVFDLLHVNHLKMIEYARGLGDILIVGVSTDELVKSYKFTPVIPFEERITMVKAVKGPDVVIPQRSLNYSEIAKKLNFDVFVIGDDWLGEYDYLKKEGISVVYFPYGEGVSSSKLKEKIFKNYEQEKEKINEHLSKRK